MTDRIICPHCDKENQPLDDERTSIEFTNMNCEYCEEEFNMSRKVEIDYITWN